MGDFATWWADLMDLLYTNIIKDGRYLLYLEGLGNTLLLTFGALIIGTILGTLIAIVKIYALNRRAFKPLAKICDVYLSFFRGTPVMVQVMIFGFVLFSHVKFGIGMLFVAMLCFGLNSAAYVAEIVRAGILAVNIGQTEAGRSLGLTDNMTMRLIILPQAIKNILPALANESITLLKETAVANVIATSELTYASTLIRSRTYNAMVPLLFIALIYWIVVSLMTALLRRLERRLAKGDRR